MTTQSSFYPNGGQYVALANSDEVLVEMQADVDAAAASATAAATSATSAATSASSAATAVQAAAGTATPAAAGVAAVGVSTKWAHDDHVHPTDTSRAPLAAPAFTGAATAVTLAATGALTAFSGTAAPAGGTTGSGLRLSSATNLGVFFGSGAPTLSASQGSLYLRTDGSSTSTRLYVNTNGTTGWTNVTTAT